VQKKGGGGDSLLEEKSVEYREGEKTASSLEIFLPAEKEEGEYLYGNP